VDAAEPEKTVRFNITARESQLSEIDSRAQAARLTRSAFMVHSSLGGKKAGWVRIRPASRVSRQRRKSA
jgi:hypothetical protein